MTITKELLNVRETAAQLGVHENTVRNWERAGDLVAIKLPGSGFRRFRREDIERMRSEMWTMHAPANEMPEQRKPRTKRKTLTSDDY